MSSDTTLILLYVIIVLLILVIICFGINAVLKKNKNKIPQHNSENNPLTGQIQQLNISQGQLIKAIDRNRSELSRMITSSINGNQDLRQQFQGYEKKSETYLRQLSDLFSGGSKQTGDLGEQLCLRLLSHAQKIQSNNPYLVINSQKTIPGTNTIPDFTIEGVDQQFPPVHLDVKFPKETFLKYKKHPHDENCRQNFIKSLKQNITDIHDKYLRDSARKKNTAVNTYSPFAVVFFPSEDLFQSCLTIDRGFGRKQTSLSVHQQQTSQKYDRGFLDFCFDQHVVPTSATNLIAVLATLERYFALFHQIQSQEKDIEQIQKWKSYWSGIDETLQQIRHYTKKINQDLDKINQKMRLGLTVANKLPSKK